MAFDFEHAMTSVLVRGRWKSKETITARSGRAAIAASRARGKLERASRLNPSLTHGDGLDILERGIAVYPDDAPIHPLIAKNIKREAR